MELIRHGIVVGWDWGQELGAGKREALLKLLQVAENKHREKHTCTKTLASCWKQTQRETIPVPRFKRTTLTCTVTPQSFTKGGGGVGVTPSPPRSKISHPHLSFSASTTSKRSVWFHVCYINTDHWKQKQESVCLLKYPRSFQYTPPPPFFSSSSFFLTLQCGWKLKIYC